MIAQGIPELSHRENLDEDDNEDDNEDDKKRKRKKVVLGEPRDDVATESVEEDIEAEEEGLPNDENVLPRAAVAGVEVPFYKSYRCFPIKRC